MTVSVWTEKHNEFCLKHRFPSSVRALWQWLLETKEENSGEIEFSLKEFNAWVEKQRGKGYDPKTLKSAAQRLLEIGAFIDEKCEGFKWCWKRWIIRPINLLVNPPKPRKKVQESGKISDSDRSNPQSAADKVQTTTTVDNEDLATKVEVCRRAGIRYMGRGVSFLRDYTVAKITKAIAFFFASGANNREKVPNSEGWFRACLRDDYVGQHECRQREDSSGDNYYSPQSPIARRQTQEWMHRGCVLG